MKDVNFKYNHNREVSAFLKDQGTQKKFTECLSRGSLFWMSMIVFQRAIGTLKCHAGIPSPFTFVLGSTVVASSDYFSKSFGLNLNSQLWGDNGHSQPNTNRGNFKLKPKEILANSCLTLCLFALLERNMFKTALPSSIISRGAFARNLASVKATSDVASSSQRAHIQLFGKKFGCHHCGSKKMGAMMFRDGFIADHMPPTNYISKQMKTWWGRTLNSIIPMTQKLYPQCTKCFRIQGNHVKMGTDAIVYHSRFRLVHLSPILADLVSPFIPIDNLKPFLEKYKKIHEEIDILFGIK